MVGATGWLFTGNIEKNKIVTNRDAIKTFPFKIITFVGKSVTNRDKS